MPIFEIICLANSVKYGGRCIAGIKTDGSGWFRPVSDREYGALHEEHYLLENEREPQLFDILQIDCAHLCPQPHQPENWQISDKWWECWKWVGRATIEQLNALLAEEMKAASRTPHLLGNQRDRVEWENLQENPAKASLCLIRPQTLTWKIESYREGGKRRFRAIFTLQGIEYNLSVTDPIWRETLDRLPDGEYDAQKAIEVLNLERFAPDGFLLVISLGEPFQPAEEKGEYCFKLVAAVLNRDRARALLEEENKSETSLPHTPFAPPCAAHSLMTQALALCWDALPTTEQTLERLNQEMQAVFDTACNDFAASLPAETLSRLEKIRQKYPNAYAPWLPEDDAQLEKRFEQGDSIADLAEHFGRQPNAIRSRLKKLGLH
ncbi:dual OB domain-containing protein [Lusitaniella coriacea]|uniref:dual OB domain-containing protein n=1 Tax=Lusitaniella coriacea TaxID=1983105 RepID=UPI003CFA261F